MASAHERFVAAVGAPLTPVVTGSAFVTAVLTTLNGLVEPPVEAHEAAAVAADLRATADRVYGQMTGEYLGLGVVTRRFTAGDVAADVVSRVLPSLRAARERHRAHVEAKRAERAGAPPVPPTDRPTGATSSRAAPLFSAGGAGFSRGGATTWSPAR